MKINQVKQFVQSNISRIKLENNYNNSRFNKMFNLYDKKNNYCGDYQFQTIGRSTFLGIKEAISNTRILSEKLKLLMQEFVHMQKKYVILKDETSDTLTKAVPSEIITTSTVLDYEKDKYITVRTVSKLKNKLKRLSNDDPHFKTETYEIYEPLNEKPKYEKNIEYVTEGSISEKNKSINRKKNNILTNDRMSKLPYKYW